MDEALLNSVAGDPSMAVVRTYEWSIPTLSLGYFQEVTQAACDGRWAEVAIVRRPTGGGALWHDQEVTYAVVIPGTHPASRPSRALYQTVHEAIAHRLRDLGIGATRRLELVEESAPPANPGDRPFLCFTDRDEQDIVFRNAKLVGSAQRRRSGAVLQHGSLLLSRSARTPDLPGLNDLSTTNQKTVFWADLLRSAIVQALGLVATVETGLTSVESDDAERLRSEVYANPAWTSRR